MRALVVEDEATLREQIVQHLRTEGFAVDATGDGLEGQYMAQEMPVDVAIIDLGLPTIDGIEIIKSARANDKEYPILILTARTRWQEKVEGLEAGADDYLTKPFHMEELMARLRALLRRSAGWAQPILQCGPLCINTSAQSVTVNDEPIELTAYEYKVLNYLALHAGQVISKSTLTEHIYEEDSERDSNVLEVFIRRLRRKLDPEGTLNPIETLRGRGYRLALSRGGESEK